jgi:hypothetical protein
MITPAYSPTATERVLPRMALDFTTGVLDSRVTISRALNTATCTNSSGVIEIVNANLPRFDYNPVTLAARGLLIEETRTNLFLNSLINGTSLSTQSVTVAAVAYTISFYGTGTITLSGASSATVTGTGVYPSRRTLTFTPTAGVLICTVTGSVQYAQIEIGGFATSFIPTAATSVTRNADVVSMTGTNFSSWYNASEGTFATEFSVLTIANPNGASPFSAYVNSSNLIRNWIWPGQPSTPRGTVNSAGSNVVDITNGTIAANTAAKTALAYKLNDYAFSLNSGVPATDTSGAVPVGLTTLYIGSTSGGVDFLNGHSRKLQFYPLRLTNDQLRAISK